jgi:hypothetical protein
VQQDGEALSDEYGSLVDALAELLLADGQHEAAITVYLDHVTAMQRSYE